MQDTKRLMKLGLFLMSPGHHAAAWRHPEVQAEHLLDINFYKQLAQTAERGKLDMIFLADGLALWDKYGSGVSHSITTRFEPLTLLSVLSTTTNLIGLAATVSSTYSEPYNVARSFASLDHLSGGRAAWNVVTSISEEEALNFNREGQLEHDNRYERAGEFVEVVTGLWDGWEDDAIVLDKDSGQVAHADKVHALNHKGKYFSVRGPLNISRPPQGRPVIIQAGASEAGRELAAQSAEVVFAASKDLATAQSFYTDMKERASKHGRAPEDLVILPGIYPIVGRTKEEAEAKARLLDDGIHPEGGLHLLSHFLDYDLSGYDVDGPLPALPDVEEVNGGKSRYQLIRGIAEREGLTIKQLYRRFAAARGHQQIVGTAEEIADHLEEWFIQKGADGFNVMPPYLPGGLDDFVELVIPELQRRGLFRLEYEGRTLREHLGLKRPVNRYEQLRS